MILINQRDRRPIYEQIAEKLSDLMAQGVLKQDAPLPSVRALATELSINPNTVQRAYLELEREGCIYSVKGRGSFVAAVQQIRDKKREAVFLDLAALVTRGHAAGITEEEFTGQVHILFHTARQTEYIEKGVSHD
ncbi:MAG: GntR family transcriptional regulator [Stomatobaculum sp.]